jgi:hypothetical protein
MTLAKFDKPLTPPPQVPTLNNKATPKKDQRSLANMEEKLSMLRQRRRRRRGLGMVRAGMRVRPWTKCMMEEPDGTFVILPCDVTMWRRLNRAPIKVANSVKEGCYCS